MLVLKLLSCDKIYILSQPTDKSFKSVETNWFLLRLKLKQQLSVKNKEKKTKIRISYSIESNKNKTDFRFICYFLFRIPMQ